jgi:hypothetical protein
MPCEVQLVLGIHTKLYDLNHFFYEIKRVANYPELMEVFEAYKDDQAGFYKAKVAKSDKVNLEDLTLKVHGGNGGSAH